MGANSVTRTYDGNLSAQELKREFAADQDQCRFENGSSYSGEIGMLQGLVIESQTFPSVDEATSYILDKAEEEHLNPIKFYVLRGRETLFGHLVSETITR